MRQHNQGGGVFPPPPPSINPSSLYQGLVHLVAARISQSHATLSAISRIFVRVCPWVAGMKTGPKTDRLPLASENYPHNRPKTATGCSESMGVGWCMGSAIAASAGTVGLWAASLPH